MKQNWTVQTFTSSVIKFGHLIYRLPGFVCYKVCLYMVDIMAYIVLNVVLLISRLRRLFVNGWGFRLHHYPIVFKTFFFHQNNGRNFDHKMRAQSADCK